MFPGALFHLRISEWAFGNWVSLQVKLDCCLGFLAMENGQVTYTRNDDASSAHMRWRRLVAVAQN